MTPLIAADGAASVVRRAMAAQLGTRVTEDLLDHGYKELTLPPGPGGTHVLEKYALHVWPRGRFMLIALPNLDGSFTMTLFLPLEGLESFAALEDRETVLGFFRRHFPDVWPLVPGLAREFLEHPVGRMGTVHAERWAAPRGQAVLLGDAAHAIVPFHGQGMNACFEDCSELARLLESCGDLADSFDAFERLRKPDTDAIAAMALENYVEMRDTVRDPKFMLRKELSFELERRFPERFIPRYSMVMFHHEIPYRVARERGRVQEAILDELSADAVSLEDVDQAAAGNLVLATLGPISREPGDA
jgi:kynurenine 3-monooxygenase